MAKDFLETYEIIKGVVGSMLIQSLKGRHYEDAVQFVAMKWIENGNKGNLRWYFLDYCRQNGLSPRAKTGSKAIENATFVGQGNEDGNCEFLLGADETEGEKVNIKEMLLERAEDDIDSLELPEECNKWAKKIYLSRLQPKDDRTFNSLIKSFA